MRRARLRETCARLERAAATRTKAAALELGSLEAKRSRDRVSARLAQAELLRAARWTAHICTAIDLRALRATRDRVRSTQRASALRAVALAEETERRDWARVVHGLDRRAHRTTRSPAFDPSWHA